MSQYIGEIKAFTFDFVPAGFIPCDGSAVLKTMFPSLYSLIRETYNTDAGPDSFNVPDLRAKACVGSGLAGFEVGDEQGRASWAVPGGSSTGVSNGTYLRTFVASNPQAAPPFVPPPDVSGNSANYQPSLAINYCIAFDGVFPVRP